MNSNDKDNLYVIEDENDANDTGEDLHDHSPLNFAAYDHDETYEDIEGVEKDAEHAQSSFKSLLKIMFNPVEGWKKLRRNRINIENLQSNCFYPLLAILALSNFMEYVYSVNVNLSEVITESVISFVAYFFGYLSIPTVCLLFLPKDSGAKFDGDFGKKYILISLSSLVLFSIFTNLLPMIWPILIFLPIWTLYIMFKGVRFFHLNEREEIKFYVLVSTCVIGIPLLIDWGLNEIMPI